MSDYDYAVVTTSFVDNHGGEKMLTAMAKEGWRLVQLVREGAAVYFYMEREAKKENVEGQYKRVWEWRPGMCPCCGAQEDE